jgi:hypothetical protein
MLWEASVVGGYRLAGLDGEIGSVRDFYFDGRSWVIRYLIADTGNWLTGIPTCEGPGGSPRTREYETRLHEHYDRRGYWVDEPVTRGDQHRQS